LDRIEQIAPEIVGSAESAEYYRGDTSEIRQEPQSEWVWLLWGNRRFIGRVVGWSLIIATVIAFLIPKKFESTTKVMPPDERAGSGMAAMLTAALAGTGAGAGAAGLGSLAGDLLGMKNTGALFIAILNSRTVQDHLIDRFDLRKVYSDRYREQARKDLSKRTYITDDRKSGVITLTVTDRDPNRAAQMAAAYVDELDRLVAKVSTSSARRERIFLEQRLATARVDVDKAAKEFSEYSSKNATLDLKEQGVAMVEAAAILQGQLIAAQSELQGLEQIYSDSNVRVRSLRARIEELSRQLKKVGGDSAISPGAADSRSQQELPSIRELPLLGVRWTDLYREVKVQGTVYELLTQQFELAKIQEAKEIPTVKVLDVADVPERKSSPQRALIIFVGTLLGLGASIAWLHVKRRWERMDPQDPRKMVAQNMFSSVAPVATRFLRYGSDLLRRENRTS
jgi:capsule polysaccharide export protein KpsE/RkpR